MQSEIIRRKCDWCGEQEDFGKNDDRPDTLERNSQWITLARLYFPNGQQYPVVKHACKSSCALNIIGTGMLELPQEVAFAAQKQAIRIREQQLDQQEQKVREAVDAASKAENLSNG